MRVAPSRSVRLARLPQLVLSLSLLSLGRAEAAPPPERFAEITFRDPAPTGSCTVRYDLPLPTAARDSAIEVTDPPASGENGCARFAVKIDLRIERTPDGPQIVYIVERHQVPLSVSFDLRLAGMLSPEALATPAVLVSSARAGATSLEVTLAIVDHVTGRAMGPTTGGGPLAALFADAEPRPTTRQLDATRLALPRLLSRRARLRPIRPRRPLPCC